MSKGKKVVFVSIGLFLTLLIAIGAIMVHGLLSYVNSCAHIKPNDMLTVEAGQTVYIDDLAEFSNYDVRYIDGVIGLNAELSEDKQSFVIEDSGVATVYLFATNSHAPETTSREIQIRVIDMNDYK